jgi:hypothetical protein
MSYNFTQALGSQSAWKKTENYADALETSGSALLDLFATIGALRTREETDIQRMFSKAFAEDKLLATKIGFYARNIRGGLGERRTARLIWSWLAVLHPDIMRKNMHLIPVFGRWDDLYIFVGTPLEDLMWSIMYEQFRADVRSLRENGNVSLLGKWLKSINTSSKESSQLGKKTAKAFNLTEAQYRRALSALRAKIDVVERKMTSNQWDKINFEAVPSKAMNKLNIAFRKHSEERFLEYLHGVEKGEKKINAGTLYPYDITEKLLYTLPSAENIRVMEAQWNALPNYVEGENSILVMADVSGSMSGRPLATSVGLAVYFAQRNKGPFKDVFMTFSERPDFVRLKGSNLYEILFNASHAQWNMNTDIEKAFRLILQTAVDNRLSQKDLPKSLLIISDMEFDQASRSGKKTYYKHMKELYAENGYELPKVIFWNVQARQNTFHAQVEDGVQFASGQATSVFKSIIKNTELSAYDMMIETLNDSIYNEVTV